MLFQVYSQIFNVTWLLYGLLDCCFAKNCIGQLVITWLNGSPVEIDVLGQVNSFWAQFGLEVFVSGWILVKEFLKKKRTNT